MRPLVRMPDKRSAVTSGTAMSIEPNAIKAGSQNIEFNIAVRRRELSGQPSYSVAAIDVK